MAGPQIVLNSFSYKTFQTAITRPDNTTAYASGDIIADVTTNNHFAFGDNAATPSDDADLLLYAKQARSVVLNQVVLHSSANQATKPEGELWLFDTDIAEVGDNAAFAPSDTEMLTRVAVVDIASWRWKVGTSTSGTGGNAAAEINNLDIPLYIPKGKLWGVYVFRGAYTPIASEVWTLRLGLTRDVC